MSIFLAVRLTGVLTGGRLPRPWPLALFARFWRIGVAHACLALLLAGAWPSSAVSGAPDAAENAKNHINLAARQRMLSQQMARDACFVMAGIDGDRFAGKAVATVQRFGSTLAALRSGDENLRLLPETDPAVLDALTEVDALWATLGPAVLQIAAHDLHSVPMRQLIELNMTVLTRLEAMMVEVRRVHSGSGEDAADFAVTVSIAGRQRMLSQKMSKDLCLLMLDIDPVSTRAALEESIALFETSMRDLMTGAPERGILPPPKAQVTRQLGKADKVWQDFLVLLRRSLDTPDQSDIDRVRLANLSNHLLLEMNSAVMRYLE